MSSIETRFYVSGGTLRPDAPSYVERQADTLLYDSLTHGDFCYVLTSRQMGKSSLIVHAAARLGKEGIAVALLDLTAIGQNLSPEQWYGGLLRLLGHQLDPGGDLEDALDDFWFEQPQLGPHQRWMTALRRIVLERVPGRVVICVDEIDAVRSLPFSTDEFFAGVRECYNRRTEDPDLARLTFCLVGVASPSDLIQDVRTTPFNIGKRIELTDFTEMEAAPLVQGLGREERVGVALLERVLHWTGGHPYLTQRLCQAVAEEGTVSAPAGVDRLCGELFLTPAAREREDNLLFVRDRLLRSGGDRAGLLDLYGLVWQGKRVKEDETNPLVTILRLSGITRSVGGYHRVRNRIYERVFDRQWITSHMPDAELRRQRAAFRRGLLRATGVAAVIVAVIGGLALTAAEQARRAQDGQEQLRRSLYAAQMNLAQQAWEGGKLERARELLDAQRPTGHQEDLRVFEWRYLWDLCKGDALVTLRGHTAPVRSVAVSPDGKFVAAGSGDGTIRLWEIATQRQIAAWTTHGRSLRDVVVQTIHGISFECLSFSPDSRLLAFGSGDGTLTLWDAVKRKFVASTQVPRAHFHSISFSRDGRSIASISDDGIVRLWTKNLKKCLGSFRGHSGPIRCAALFPDGQLMALAGWDRKVTLWSTVSKRRRGTISTGSEDVASLVVSPDGKSLATGHGTSVIQLWNTITGERLGSLRGHRGWIRSVAISPDGRLLASASDDRTIRLWDLARQQELRTLRGHGSDVNSVVFSADGKILASTSNDRTVRLWAVQQHDPDTLVAHSDWLHAVGFSPDGKIVASGGGDRTVRLWDVSRRRTVAVLRGHTHGVMCLAFSPDGKILAVGCYDGTLRLWDLTSRRELATVRTAAGEVWTLSFSPDSRLLAATTSAQTLELWDVAGRRRLTTLEGPEVWGGPAAFTPDGKTLITTRDRKTITLWDVATRQRVGTLSGSRQDASWFALAPDGKTLASTDGDTIRLWDIATRQRVASLKGSLNVGIVVFSPDGKTLATGSGDDSFTFWSLATKQEVGTYHHHRTMVTYAQFSPDGTALATASGDATVHLWYAPRFTETDLTVPRSAITAE